MRRRGRIALVAAVLALLAAPVVGTAPLPSGSLAAVAARFTPGDGAVLVADATEPRRLWCLGDHECPSAVRAWELDDRVRNEDLRTWLAEAGYDAEVDGDCASGACRARGTADQWRVTVFVRNPDLQGPSRVSLSVRRSDTAASQR